MFDAYCSIVTKDRQMNMFDADMVKWYCSIVNRAKKMVLFKMYLSKQECIIHYIIIKNWFSILLERHRIPVAKFFIAAPFIIVAVRNIVIAALNSTVICWLHHGTYTNTCI